MQLHMLKLGALLLIALGFIAPAVAAPRVAPRALAELTLFAETLNPGESTPVDLRFTAPLKAGGVAQFSFNELSAPRARRGAKTYKLRGTARVLARGAGRDSRTTSIPLGATLVLSAEGGKLVVLPFQRTLRARTAFHRLEFDLKSGALLRGARAPEQLFEHSTCAAHGPSAPAQYAASLGGSSLPVARATNGYVATLSTDAAGDFFTTFGASSNAEIAIIINQASAVYEAQLSIRIDVVDQNVQVTSSPFPESVTDPVAVLQDFVAYFVANRHLVTADTYMLFVSREMNDATLGIAFIDAVCRDVADVPAPFSVVRYQSRAATWVTAAHELGHNFGAEHVDSPRGIMSTVLTSPLPDKFAPASVTEINNYIKSIPPGSFCLDGARIAPPKSPSVSLTTRNATTGLSATLKVATLQAACVVRLRAGTSSSKAKRGTIVARATPNARTIRFTSGLGVGSPTSSVYLVAEHKCPGLSSSYSRVRKVSSRSGGVSTGSFIRRLKVNLQESLF